MSDTSNLSEAKRALLEKLLRGKLFPTSVDAETITRRAHDGPVPLSFAQQQFWLLSRLTPHLPVYHLSVSISLPGPLDRAALEQSFNELIRRHEVWRTSFPLIEGQPVQQIHPPSIFRLPFTDLRRLPRTEREAEALRLAAENTTAPFDLSQAPPLRARLVCLDDEEHRLFLTLHHIISDGFSVSQILLPELYALYQAYATGQPSLLPELPIQYADYACWQRETLDERALAEHLDFWKHHLAGAPTDLALPGDHPRPVASKGQMCAHSFTLPAQTTAALKALSQQGGATLFMTLLAAYAVLLARCSGQEDLIIGTPSAGRKQEEVRGLLGVFINTLALRLDLSGDPGFRALLQRVRETTLSTLDHEDMPFEHLVKELHPERAPRQNPFFQTMFTLESPPPALPSGWAAALLHIGAGLDAGFDLSLALKERPEDLSGTFDYNTDLFEAATIERMAGHFQTLLEGIAVDPDQPISQLLLLPEAEREQMLVEWNATQADYPQDQCVHWLFEQQVARAPDAVALVSEGRQLTYGELNARANQLAHHLQKQRVGPETLVGLCVERSLEMAVGLLGIFKAGGAYVPLDPSYPTERLAFMLEDSQAAVLLTQQHLLAQLPAQNARVICLDGQWAEIAQEPTTNPVSAVQADNLAYVIYTSGSTGKPKGVQIAHRALVNHNLAFIKHFDVRPADRILQFASLSFDTAAEEIFPCWLAGAALVLRPVQVALTFEELFRLIEHERLSILNLPTAYWHTWTYELAKANTPLPESLRWVITGGEQALLQRLTLWQERVPKRVRWSNCYGPTEATIGATTYDLVREGEDQEVSTILIGRPNANLQVYALDAHLQPVPIGVPGELYIGGDGLARGYLNRPELTAERFIPNPFSQEPGARLYKTGDLARYHPDGNLEYIGRADFQVKIRGFRIEPGEIESILSQHPQVREAVVVAREDTPGEKRLVAYLVPAAGQSPTSSALRGFLKEHLPEHMIPSAFVMLEYVPLTPNGKLNRRALPAPEGDREQPEAALAAPRTPTEEQLAAIWTELLGLKQVGINENFFELGGHSLLAVRALSRAHDIFNIELPLSSLFEAPTIASLAIRIVQCQADQIEDGVTAQLLAELEQLSDHEAQDILVIESKRTER
ncbi:MAG TPA: amino acid adenylation domain-containing protein [Ktedonobacterales bacterium]|jgi:amino acid adenylation domain-containing protein